MRRVSGSKDTAILGIFTIAVY